MVKYLIKVSLHNRLLMSILGIGVLLAGYWSFRTLPVDAFPDISPNLVQVFTVTEGLAPEEVETYVTYAVETALTGLPGVTKIRSISTFGLSAVSVYFEDRMNLYFCRQLVNERLQEAREQIPEGFGEPELGPISSVIGRVLYYYLEDTAKQYSLEQLRSIQDWIIKPHLQRVPGVTEVLCIGGYEKQYQIVVQPDALLRFDLTLADIIQRITDNNLNVGAQFIEKNGEQMVVRSVGLATGIDDLSRIVVKNDNNGPLYLGDVAEIKIGGAVRQGLQTRNGQGEVVAAQVIRLYGTNASEIIGRVELKITEINQILPSGVHIVPYYQQRDIVHASVTTVRNALLQGIGLVILVLLLFMGGLRPSLIVVLAIPFSILFTFIVMHYLKISANLMSFPFTEFFLP